MSLGVMSCATGLASKTYAQSAHATPPYLVTQNGSGYKTAVGYYTTITGAWIVPKVTASGRASADSTWIGIGSDNGPDLIQVGTQNAVSSNGIVVTKAFIEMLPGSPQIIPLSVHGGDAVTATITELVANQWLFTFKDNTTGQTYQISSTYVSSHAVAEWIEEAPIGIHGQLPLDNFDVAQFTSAATTQNGKQLSIAAAGGQVVIMGTTDGQILAIPSQLGDDGASFNVSRFWPSSKKPRIDRIFAANYDTIESL